MTSYIGFARVAVSDGEVGAEYSPEQARVIAGEMDGWIGHLLMEDREGQTRTSQIIAAMRERRLAMLRVVGGP